MSKIFHDIKASPYKHSHLRLLEAGFRHWLQWSIRRCFKNYTAYILSNTSEVHKKEVSLQIFRVRRFLEFSLPKIAIFFKKNINLQNEVFNNDITEIYPDIEFSVYSSDIDSLIAYLNPDRTQTPNGSQIYETGFRTLRNVLSERINGIRPNKSSISEDGSEARYIDVIEHAHFVGQCYFLVLEAASHELDFLVSTERSIHSIDAIYESSAFKEWQDLVTNLTIFPKTFMFLLTGLPSKEEELTPTAEQIDLFTDQLSGHTSWGQRSFFLLDSPLNSDVFLCPWSKDVARRVFRRMEAIPWTPLDQEYNGREFFTKGPFTCAIYGPWGAGKTSMLQTIQAAFDSNGTFGDFSFPDQSPTPDYITVKFEPWRFENEPHLIIPLISEITNTILNHKDYAQSFKNKRARQNIIKLTKKLIGLASKHLLRETIKHKFSEQAADTATEVGEKLHKFYSDLKDGDNYPRSETLEFKHNLEDLLQTISDIRRKQAKRSQEFYQDKIPPIAIFIDDIDRCEHKQVKNLLEAIKVFLSEPGIIYFLALDEDQVLRSLGQTYRDSFDEITGDREKRIQATSRRYLEKFFQHHIDLGDGFSPIPEAIEDLQEDCWFELCRVFSGFYSDDPFIEQFYEFVGIESRFEGIGWLESFSKDADERTRDQRHYVLAFSDLFQAAKRNPRNIKALTRWLFFNLRRGGEIDIDPSIAGGRPTLNMVFRDFAEQVFAMNFGNLWVNEFHYLQAEVRQVYYSEVARLLEQAGILDLIEPARLHKSQSNVLPKGSEERKKAAARLWKELEDVLFAPFSEGTDLEDNPGDAETAPSKPEDDERLIDQEIYPDREMLDIGKTATTNRQSDADVRSRRVRGPAYHFEHLHARSDIQVYLPPRYVKENLPVLTEELRKLVQRRELKAIIDLYICFHYATDGISHD